MAHEEVLDKQKLPGRALKNFRRHMEGNEYDGRAAK